MHEVVESAGCSVIESRVPDIPVRNEAAREGGIDLTHDYEVIYWTARLGCSSRQLREAVAAVGPRVSEVIAYLRRQEGR